MLALLLGLSRNHKVFLPFQVLNLEALDFTPAFNISSDSDIMFPCLDLQQMVYEELEYLSTARISHFNVFIPVRYWQMHQ